MKYFRTATFAKRPALFLLLIVLMGSCSTKKEILLFQDIENVTSFEALEAFEPVIEINDVLKINVSSANQEVIAPYQLNFENQGNSGGGSENAILNGYLVDSKGTIQFPSLGGIEVAGFTREELEVELTEKLREFVTDVVVQVRIVNFKVTILGEVGSKGVKRISDERVTMPELIALSGGITYDGKRDNILVIRDTEGKKTYGYVDMTSSDVFKNPFYYLKQNDLVYVEPTYRKVKSAGFITNYTGFFSLITSIVGLIFIFSR